MFLVRIQSLFVIALLATPSLALSGDVSFTEDLSKKKAAGAFATSGSDDGRFLWEPNDGLSAIYDSSLEDSRLMAPLGFELTGASDFVVEVDFTIQAIEGGPDDFMQFAFGLVNSRTTGLNRTGTSLPGPPFFDDDSDVYDSVEFAYFPNETFFGGPFLQPAVFGAEMGSPFANFAGNFGASADLGDNGAGEVTSLPVGVPLRVRMAHDGCAQALVTRIFDLSERSPVELATGVTPIDLSFLNTTGTFSVDSFAVTLHQDHADFDPSTRSLFADVDFHRVAVTPLEPVSARLLPRSLNASAGGGAMLQIRDVVDAGAALKLIEVDGDPVDVELDATATGSGDLHVKIPRELLGEDSLMIQLGGCLLDVSFGTPGK
jgi:hypothetical protein